MVRPCVARGFVELAFSGLASMYPVSDWSCFAPDQYGYQRACDLICLDALEGAPLVENRPGDAGELVGERNRQHVVVQSFLGGFDPRFEAIALPTLYLDQHNPRGLHEQNAQVAIAAP